MIRFITLLMFLWSAPASSDVRQAVDFTQTLYQDFETRADALSNEAERNCTPAALIPAYHKAFDAWVAASIFDFGPIDDVGGPLSIAFWPDKKGFTLKAVNRLLTEDASILKDKVQFAEVSVAGKGFFALELLLFDADLNGYSENSAACDLVQAITDDIAHKAERMNTLWEASFADFVLTAGAPGNTVFLSKKEAAQAYLTTTIGALEFLERARLGRPIGTLDRRRPKRAEGWRSNRSLHNINISLRTIDELVKALADNKAPVTEEELSAALKFIPSIEDKSFQAISETSVLFKVETLLQMVINIKEAAVEELSLHLGVNAGFNALDGD